MELRPTHNDAHVMDAFFTSMAHALYSDSDMAAGMSLTEIEKGLRYAGHPSLDGYEYAKQLESNGWVGISAQDIETLECAHNFLSQAVSDAEVEWMQRNNIEPPFQSGSLVRARIARLLPGVRRAQECVTEGRVYLDERNSRTGHCTFRDKEWVATRGDQGGYVLRWEVIEVI